MGSHTHKGNEMSEKTYTAETVETTTGLMPKFRRTITQHRVLCDGELYGYAKTAEGAELAAKMLNGEVSMSEEMRSRIFS